MSLKFFLFVLSVSFFNTLLNAQKPNEPFSCYSHKNHSLRSAQALDDNRGDFIKITNYKIDLDISDFTTKTLSGYTQVSFIPIQDFVAHIDLDLLMLTVDSVTLFDTVLLSFTHNDTLIHINFPQDLTKNFSYKIKVYYHGAPIQTPGDWGGFFWNSTYAFNIGVSFTEDIHNFGKAWFPCFDNFTERSTYDFAITTQDNHKAFCNGLLQNEIDNINNTKTWIWKLNQEIPTYLANVAVANYATVNQIYNKVAGGSVPIQLAARPTDTTNLKNSFIHLNDALLSYETRFGPYRFDRVGYCVTSFTAGAMEHATNITYMAPAVNGATTYETLMAHELSHHWFGNNTTCSTASDMWLNEGWASYAEAIFTESVYGTEAFKAYNRKNHDDVLRNVAIYDGAYLPVSGVASEHTYSSTVYSKGADMAHSLRGILGDAIFFDAMKAFQSQFAFKHIDSDLLEDFLSGYSNLNLTHFFTSWIKEKGFHHFEISDITILSNANSGFAVQGSVKQKLWEATIFTDFLPMPITFFDANWNRYDETIFIYGECSDFQFDLPFEPIFWALDLDERLQDAIVDKYEIINQTGTYDFEEARLILDVQSLSDSALVRVEHHFIKPDPMLNKPENLHLSPNRYWTISGILPDDFEAIAQFHYNGSTNTSNGNLDNDLIQIAETNLTLLYRPDSKTDWTEVADKVINTVGSVSNKVGYFTVNNVQKGDYVLAINDANLPDDNSTKTECVYTNIQNVARLDKLIQIYPVPTKNYINISLTAKDIVLDEMVFVNTQGEEIQRFKIKNNQYNYPINVSDWAKGVYFVQFLDDTKMQLIQKKIIVE
jgi:hypothetical protein